MQRFRIASITLNVKPTVNAPIIDISIVIPCYNHGHFIGDAISSVEAYLGDYKHEIVVVNDGSVDPFTIRTLQQLENQGYIVVNQKNQGIGAARNNGILLSKGRYILPLDSDNKIRPEYISNSIKILDGNPNVGVVYGNSLFFGEENKRNEVPEFRLIDLLFQNTIDACAVFRKSIWEKIGGYDEQMPIMGYEDWEFWIRVARDGWNFKHVNEVLFEYRVRDNSMIKNANQYNNQKIIRHYMIKKHSDMYLTLPLYLKLFDEYLATIAANSSLRQQIGRKDEYYRKLKSNPWLLFKTLIKSILSKAK